MFRFSLFAAPSALIVPLMASPAMAQGAGGAAGAGGAGGAGSGGPLMCESGILEFSGSNTQSGRVFRDGVQSSCPSKTYPGIFNAGATFNYETFVYENTEASSKCITVDFDPNVGDTPCGTNAHASAYLGSYDPNDQATNFVGDVGSSVTQSFSFEVPATTELLVVVSNTSSAAICNFAFTVNGLPCVECGNGFAELDEECDDAGNSATCNADCTVAACGDLYVNPAAGEDCDEGVESATCDIDCTLPECGDSYVSVQVGETCDDGGDSATCDSDCTIAECGDGYTNDAAGEECDDGGVADGDGCSATCTLEGGAGGGGGAGGSEGGAAGGDGVAGGGGSMQDATTSGTTGSGGSRSSSTTSGAGGSNVTSGGASSNVTTGGAEAGSAGAAGANDGASDGGTDDSGCSCRLPASRPRNSGLLAGLVLAFAAAFRRRRKARAA